MYYIFANLKCLNNLRKQHNLNTFQFKPHCGEAGTIDHLISGYFMSEAINHGLVLESSQVVKYLFYLTQIGIAMSPVSNNRIFCRYQENPFRKYFY